jgi:hypothetical protein
MAVAAVDTTPRVMRRLQLAHMLAAIVTRAADAVRESTERGLSNVCSPTHPRHRRKRRRRCRSCCRWRAGKLNSGTRRHRGWNRQSGWSRRRSCPTSACRDSMVIRGPKRPRCPSGPYHRQVRQRAVRAAYGAEQMVAQRLAVGTVVETGNARSSQQPGLDCGNLLILRQLVVDLGRNAHPKTAFHD